MIFSIIVRKKYLYGASKIIFSPETFSTSLGHTGDNLERRFRRHLGGRGLIINWGKKKKMDLISGTLVYLYYTAGN